jgi:DNA replication initiation complex subunit (GINS family)
LAGLEVGPFEEGREYEVRFWIARELERVGVVRFREEDMLDIVKLTKMHWKERVQPTNKVSPLPEEFYPKLRRYLASLKKAANSKPEKLKEHEKSTRISCDIVNCRVKKIVSLASSFPLSAQALQGLTPEERTLYHDLHKIINAWRTKIFERGGKSD